MANILSIIPQLLSGFKKIGHVSAIMAEWIVKMRQNKDWQDEFLGKNFTIADYMYYFGLKGLCGTAHAETWPTVSGSAATGNIRRNFS